MTTFHHSETQPDFADLYEPWIGRGGNITPRMAYYLWVSAQFLGDYWRLAATDPERVEELPVLARPLAHGTWIDQFAACFDRLADRIANGDADTNILSHSTGDELALHMTIDLAEEDLAEGTLDPREVTHLPEHDRPDSDFNWMREVLFEDHDVLMLFNPSLDGIEDPAVLDTANLHPRDWFRPFRAA
jgi:hypothetical protein